MAEQKNIQSAASKSIRPFRSSEEYLYAMKEDLAEWLNALYDLDVHVDAFMEALETGCALCQHANNVNQTALEFEQKWPEVAGRMKIPRNGVTFASRNIQPGSFIARDNVSNFIDWCRHDLGIQDALMFETNDLVLRKNEKNFVLCLLEVARRGSKFGMLAPMLIQMEEEIDEEIRDAMEEPLDEEAFRPRAQTRLCDFKNLDAMVREILGHCSCPSQFPMTKVSEGKYKVGETSTLIFIRVLRNHVMVRVGGGWDTLEHYLNKHDPCRCASSTHRHQPVKTPSKTSLSNSPLASRAPSPGPHRFSEGPSISRLPDNIRHLDKRTTSAAELSIMKQNGLSATTRDRPFSPTNSGSKSETAKYQGTLANTASAAELMNKRFQQSPDLGRTTSPRSYDWSEPRLSAAGRRRESSIPRRQAGDREHAATKPGPQKTPLPPRKISSDDVLIIDRRDGIHVVQRAVAQHDPGQRSIQVRRRSQSSDQRSPLKQCAEGEGSLRQPGSALPQRGRSRLPREPARTPSNPRQSSPVSIRGKAQHGDGLSSRSRETPSPRGHAGDRGGDAGKRMARTKSPGPAATQAAPRHLKPTPSIARSRAPINPARSSSPSARVCPSRRPGPVSRAGAAAAPQLLRYDKNRNVLTDCVDADGRPSSTGCCGTTGCSPTSEAEIFHPAQAFEPLREDELYRSFEEEFLANTRQISLEDNGTEASESPPDGESSGSACGLPAWNGPGEEAEVPRGTPAERPSSPEPEGARDSADGVNSNGGGPGGPADNVLQTVETVGEPVLPSPRGERELYTMELHCGPSRPGPEEEKLRNEQVPELTEVDRAHPLHPSADPGQENGEGSFIETSSESSVNLQLNAHPVQMRPRKGLKKPDRVPSVYKLKLRPKIRPRTDNRPEKRPSKIPTPISCRQTQKSPRSPQHLLLDGSLSRRKLKQRLILYSEELQGPREDLPSSPPSGPNLSQDEGSWV